MFIKNLRVQNFKSFEALELQLNQLNILIGANASGKSNFISILKFIKDIALHGLDNAVSMQGGIEYLRNINLGTSINTSVEISIRFHEREARCKVAGNGIGTSANELTCKLDLEHDKSRKGFKVSQDLLISTPIQRFFANIPTYNLDSKLAKKAIPLSGKIELEEDGSNLPIVLKRVLNSKEASRKFSNLINYVLPFVDGVSTQKFADQFLGLHIEEAYSKDKPLPAFLVSDGTINIIALILALYFEKKPVVIFEDIDKGIHPALISKVINLLAEVSEDKQLLVTTHNPQVVKHAPHESILLVSRDKSGFSKITRPLEKEEIQIFLQNNLEVDDLYVHNMLEL